MPKPKLEPIETGAQTRSAIREIQRKTQWTILRIAQEAGLTRETVRKVHIEKTVNPGAKVRVNIATLLQRVRAMK